MVFEKNGISRIEFGGMVMMYGHMQISAELNNDKVILTKSSGSDGSMDDVEEKIGSTEEFAALINAISNLNIETKKDEDDEYALYACEKPEKSGAFEWHVILYGSGEADIRLWLSGYNDRSSAFKTVSTALSNACKDFGCINDFFNLDRGE